ncbi:MAG: 3-phosphoshikimate 1-carboxyvinyltransferase [Spirochaetaceae bacterium]|nr:3-phosphoshikimate 1-carboxyvinyltransferase [Spirochaetaceae bacterium]
MILELQPGKLKGCIEAIASKSDAHRALICASFADAPCTLKISTTSKDIEATAEVLRSFGADIENTDNLYKVVPIKAKTLKCTADCNESGSTLRFLLPVAAAVGGEVLFTGQGRLPERPMTELCRALEENGVSFKQHGVNFLPLTLSGKLTGRDFDLPGNVSSQYISGLLFASAISGGGTIRLTSKLESASYVEITRHVLEKFGVKTEAAADSYIVPQNQKLISPGFYTIEGDWSCSAFWLCAKFMGSNVSVSNLDSESPQGDKAVAEILKNFVSSKECTVDCSDIPDLVPPLAVAACARKSATHFVNAARLRLKESDRIESVANMINNLGGKTETTQDSITIFGKGSLKGGTISSQNDHRIVMAAAVASTISENPVTIDGAEAVQKSYPSFFQDFNKLGGAFNVISLR